MSSDLQSLQRPEATIHCLAVAPNGVEMGLVLPRHVIVFGAKGAARVLRVSNSAESPERPVLLELGSVAIAPQIVLFFTSVMRVWRRATHLLGSLPSAMDCCRLNLVREPNLVEKSTDLRGSSVGQSVGLGRNMVLNSCGLFGLSP